MSKHYRKINDLMHRASRILVGHGWRADKFEELFGLSRSSAFRLVKWVRDERSKIAVEEALEKARRRQAEAERAERERDEQSKPIAPEGWERPSRDIRRFWS
jgi:hypothetical protein